MLISEAYCYTCSCHLLNAASYVSTAVVVDGVVGPFEMFNERGHQAIVELGSRVETARRAGGELWIDMNQQRLTGFGIFATTMVNGTTVCAGHIYDAVELTRSARRGGW